MKAIWKILGLTALAALIPVRVKRDEETGVKSYQSLLYKADVTASEEGAAIDIGFDGLLTAPLLDAIAARQEARMLTDDPQEAGLFADDEADPAEAGGPSAP